MKLRDQGVDRPVERQLPERDDHPVGWGDLFIIKLPEQGLDYAFSLLLSRRFSQCIDDRFDRRRTLVDQVTDYLRYISEVKLCIVARLRFER